MEEDVQTRILVEIGKLNTKLDMALAQKERDHLELAKNASDHEARLRQLERVDVEKIDELDQRMSAIEKRFWRAAGAIGVIAFLVGTFGPQLLQALGVG